MPFLQKQLATGERGRHWRWKRTERPLSPMRKLTLRPTRSWGVYREDHLETAFLLGRDGIASGEDGQPVDLLADAQIGLAATTEL